MKNAPASVPHVLLVDDNQDGLLVRRALLEEVGYTVEVAHNGEEGLKLFQASDFDVVVTDYRMPRMNGVELIARIRQTNPSTRIVLLSGFVEPLGLTEENTGADSVISKSASEPGHLMRAVKRLLNAGKRKPPSSQGGGQRFRTSAR
jgi:two-component system copper resistance phosphate regulon response regulator CusR